MSNKMSMLLKDKRRTRKDPAAAKRFCNFRGGILSRRGADCFSRFGKLRETFEITSARRYWIGVIVTQGEGIGFSAGWSNEKDFPSKVREPQLANLTREREKERERRIPRSVQKKAYHSEVPSNILEIDETAREC